MVPMVGSRYTDLQQEHYRTSRSHRQADLPLPGITPQTGETSQKTNSPEGSEGISANR